MYEGVGIVAREVQTSIRSDPDRATRTPRQCPDSIVDQRALLLCVMPKVSDVPGAGFEYVYTRVSRSDPHVAVIIDEQSAHHLTGK